MTKSIKICFVGYYTYPLFSGDYSKPFGGAEVRSFLISTGLAKKSHYDVSYVVDDHKQGIFESQGVTVYPHSNRTRLASFPDWYNRFYDKTIKQGIVKRTKKFPFVRLKVANPLAYFRLGTIILYRQYCKIRRYFEKRRGRKKLYIRDYIIESHMYEIYDKINADVYCVFGVSDLAGEVAAFCKAHNKKFVLFIAASTDLSESYQVDSKGHNLYYSLNHVCHYGITNADFIFTQTNDQQHLLLKRFNRHSNTIRNPIDLDNYVVNVPDYVNRTIAFWVGRADDFIKMPMHLVNLAKYFPEIDFIMVMNDGQAHVKEQVYREKTDNVQVLKSVPFDEIENYFAQALVFINTSTTEGFPNTFLQAGKYSVPILSLNVDPDNFIEQHECGIVAHGNFDKLIDGLKVIKADQVAEQKYSHNIRRYIQDHHSLSGRVEEIDRVLQKLCQD